MKIVLSLFNGMGCGAIVLKNLNIEHKYYYSENYVQLKGGFDSDNRFWKNDGKHAACVTRGADKTGVITNDYKLRRLTPTECARLQTIPEWYIWDVSDTQQYKMLGNGWTRKVIEHILSYL